MISMEPELKEIRQIERCGRTCKGCDYLQHCDYCGDNFCGMTVEYDKDWCHDKNADVMCGECAEINPELCEIIN